MLKANFLPRIYLPYSEILGVVGSVVLPILGAVPDGAIVLFSGLGDNAQEQVIHMLVEMDFFRKMCTW